MSGRLRHLRVVGSAQEDPTSEPSPIQDRDQMPQPKRVDSTADVEAAAKAVSDELARDIRGRQESIAGKRRRAQLNQGLLQRRVQGSRTDPKSKP